MSAQKLRPAAAGLLLAAAGLAAPAHAGGAVKHRELTRINAEIEQTKQEIEKYRKQEKILTEDVHGLAATSREAKAKVQGLENGARQARGRLVELQSRLESLRFASGSTRSLLERELRKYAMRRFSRDDFFASAELWKESLSRGAILQKAAWLRSLQGLGAKTQKATEEAGWRTRRLLTQSLEAQAARVKLDLKYEEKKEALSRAQQSLEAAAKRQEELEESAKELTQFIARAAKRRVRGASRAQGQEVLLDIPRHSLAWPAQGAVAEFFGRQRNAELNTWIIRQGIRLRTAAEAPITPVGPGQVIFAGPFRSYGQVVIVDHGSGFYSVYGELGKIFKSIGDNVSPEQILARAGKGRGRDGALYLELRQGSTALDPLVWLKEKK